MFVFRGVLCAAAVLVLAACTHTEAGQPAAPTRPPSAPATAPAAAWPNPGDDLTEPIMTAPAGTTPPPFPDSVEGYALSREWRTTVRAFEGSDWSTMPEFPATMNGCDLQRFYIRWRSTSPDAPVEATFLDSGSDIELGQPAAGAVGWMSGYGCGQPAFRMDAPTDDGATLIDVVVEVQQWEVAV